VKAPKEDILGFAVERLDTAGCVKEIVDWIKNGNSCRWLACLNPYSYEVSRRDSSFTEALKDADWLVPDGVGIVIASRLLNGHVRERVTGSDIYHEAQEKLNQIGGKSVFFLGATEETLTLIREKMGKDFPHIRVAGTFSPPFKLEFTDEESEIMISAVNAAKPDVLWVGMTAPKQEKWINQHRHLLEVKFVGAIGAVFDFYTNRVKRAHPFLQKLGLEWLVRLVKEPRRMWRRYLVSGPRFLWHLLLWKSSKKKP
jgi:N-acetylglucosaminyldiphosphoundecaprenol N-acetyl-beta-D-mannosaminyltransferase